MKTHTPGPWAEADRYDLRHNPCGIDIVHDGGMICRMPDGATVNGGNAFTETRANAQLIAAAPDLLAACKAIATLNEGQGRMNLCEVAGMARQAIAKAEEQK